jgi:hypothetical protein
MRRTATSFRLLLAASVLLVVVGAWPAAAAASPTGGPDGEGLAAFEWYRLSQVNTSVSGERLWSLRRDGFGAVYADVSEWLEAADQPESWSQRRRLRRLTSDLRRFVARASSQGLAVYAVAGGPGWTAESHRYLGPKVLELVADYNADADPDERLQGVQFDIEPYVDPGFWADVKASLQAYLRTVEGIVDTYEEVRTQPGNEGLGLGFAIPFWFDGTPEVPEVEFGRTGATTTTQATAFHLIDLLGKLPEAYLVVMAYRNFASGPDGSIELVRGEFDYASRVGAASGIVVGQEFTRVTPEKLSFWWAGRAAFRQAAAELTEAYGGLPQFRGISVDDMDAYQAVGEYPRRW